MPDPEVMRLAFLQRVDAELRWRSKLRPPQADSGLSGRFQRSPAVRGKAAVPSVAPTNKL